MRLADQNRFCEAPNTSFVRLAIQKPVFQDSWKSGFFRPPSKKPVLPGSLNTGFLRLAIQKRLVHGAKSLVCWGLPGGPAWRPPRRRASWRWRSRPARLFCRSCWSPWAASPRSPDTTTTNQLINQSTWWVRNQSSNNYSDPSKIR